MTGFTIDSLGHAVAAAGGVRHAQCTNVVYLMHGFNVDRAVPASAGVNHGDHLPAVPEVFNVHQACAARFAASMRGGIAPVACG